MSQRWSAILYATSAWGGKPIGRVRVNSSTIPKVLAVREIWTLVLLFELQKKMIWELSRVNFYIGLPLIKIIRTILIVKLSINF